MRVNNRSANAEAKIDKALFGAEVILDQITNPALSDIINLSTKGKYSELNTLLERSIDEIDKPILKGLLKDLNTVLSNWFEDPEVVCCLIQGIWAFFIKSYMADKNVSVQLALSATDFGKFIDILVAVLDLIIALLGANTAKLTFSIPDIFKEIMSGVFTGVLTLLQETFTAIRTTIFGKLLEIINDAALKDHTWAKCLPLNDLIRVLIKYTSDFGLFADLFNKISGLISGKVSFYKSLEELPVSLKDLEFLNRLREILLKMKYAYISMDLCVQYSYSPDSQEAINDRVSRNTFPDAIVDGGIKLSANLKPEDLGYTFIPSDRGRILIDKTRLQANGSIPLLSNSSIREFLHQYMGYNYEQVDNIITNSSAADSIQGTIINSDNLSNLNADCPNTPDPESIIRWALGLRDRSK